MQGITRRILFCANMRLAVYGCLRNAKLFMAGMRFEKVNGEFEQWERAKFLTAKNLGSSHRETLP